jgi:DNA-binding transcriptional regulator YhcF (GntR family)
MPRPSTAEARQPDYRRIADGLRDRIIGQSWPPRTQLPSTGRLAADWKTSYCTIHNALQLLVKEGWIERVHGAGTFVADPDARFLSAALYHSSDISADEESFFPRSMHHALRNLLARRGKEVRIFSDPRPEKQQRSILPELASAIRRREVHCVIAPLINGEDADWLGRLTIPTAFIYHPFSRNRADFDQADMLRKSLRKLRAQGCRSVGVIHNLAPTPGNPQSSSFNRSFREIAAENGLATQDNWIRFPSGFCRKLPEFGYREFHRLWRLPRRPEGLLVYPDMVATGAVLAVLETGMTEVTHRMKFVLQRNAHVRFLCPFPVTWTIADENVLARGLLLQVERQFAGEKIAPLLFPYRFAERATLQAAYTKI